MTEIQCECGKFKAELSGFPQNTPGRLACYCKDCQVFLHHLQRTDLLDSAGGTEIVPVYPAEFKFKEGKEFLICTRLSPQGLYRWSTSCCRTPIANTRPNFPWVGVFHRPYNVREPEFLSRTLGPVRSRIHGRSATSSPPPGTSDKIGFKDFLVVFPFLLKGQILSLKKGSPFFQMNGAPVATPSVLSVQERRRLESHLK